MTTRRQTGIALALLALVALSGCSGLGFGLGGDGVNQERLNRNVTYDWNTTANATYDVTSTKYHAVVDVRNDTKVSLSRGGNLGGEEPLPLAGVKFRYPNGTVVDAGHLDVERTRSATIVHFPARDGQFAYTTGSGARTVAIPVITEGSHQVTLPAGMRVSFPVFGAVRPGGYEKTRVGERVRLTWRGVDRDSIYVQYYLQRDLYIFGGAAAVLTALAAAGVVYFRVQIRRLERRRKSAGLDLERDDDA